MRIRLTPYDCDFLKVHWRICGDNHYFFPSCVMGSQFSAFLTAVYRLYKEENICHTYYSKKLSNFKHEYPHQREDKKHLITATVFWDEEGFNHIITFKRHCATDSICKSNSQDPIQITIKSGPITHEYTVDGRDLCYAVAKGCTEALKKYGLIGYEQSTGMQYPGDGFDIKKLLFVKAYALDAMKVRETRELWAHPHNWASAKMSDFEEEIKLLLFDM